MRQLFLLLILTLLIACADKKYFRQGNAMLKKKDYAGAYAQFDRYVKMNPTMPRAYLKRSYAAWLSGNSIQAYKDIETLLTLDSMSTLGLCNRGYMKQQAGRTEQALYDYNKALAIDRHNADAYLNRASLYFMQGMKENALNDVSKAMEHGRFSAENFAYAKGWNYYYRGVSQMKNKEYEGAIIYFTSAIAADSMNARAYYERGLALKAINNKKGACADLHKAQQMGIPVSGDMFPLNCDVK
jgi:tetratricopeptide (TPR) repeat protein